MTAVHARLAIFFSAERRAELALAEAQRAYLLAAGWIRNPEGDHWAGEAWAPPNNPKGQWQLSRALERQRDEDVALVGEISVSAEVAPPEIDRRELLELIAKLKAAPQCSASRLARKHCGASGRARWAGRQLARLVGVAPRKANA